MVMAVETKASSHWKGLLGAAVILSSAGIHAASSDVFQNCEFPDYIANGYCDYANNIADCGYDGGDCCSCTCDAENNVYDNDDFVCTEFACLDPDAPCADDDDITPELAEACGYLFGFRNGYCEPQNNNAGCEYDGGDCCECTCDTANNIYYDDDNTCTDASFDCQDPSAWCFGEPPASMSYDFALWEDEEPLPTLDGAVDVGTNTVVAVSATAYDVRPGASGGQQGCGEVGGDACAPANTLDGIVSDPESRWSCAAELVDGGGPCQIEYTFDEPQDIVDIQVAFYKGDERTRTLDVYLDSELSRSFESYAGSTFNTIGVAGTGVRNVVLESTFLAPGEWISLLEVVVFVTP
ncbi:unnamed protein product [Pylaiella littoralis]